MAVDRSLLGGMIAQGQQVRNFEEACAQYLGFPDSVAVGSGTAALSLALQALNFPAGAQAIVPTLVCGSVLTAVRDAGLIPILCDVGSDWVMTPETVGAVWSSHVAVIILVHLFGIDAEVAKFTRFKVPIVEDCCQAFPERQQANDGQSAGRIAIFSFHATKCLTTGEGGLLASDDPEVLLAARRLRDGSHHLARRLAAPMSDLQASLGLSQLSRYSSFVEKRLSLLSQYFKHLSGTRAVLPTTIKGRSSFFRFPVRVEENAEDEHRRFALQGIQVRRGVDAMLHRLTNLPSEHFDMAEKLFAQTVSIPLYPALTFHEADRIIEACHEIWRRK